MNDQWKYPIILIAARNIISLFSVIHKSCQKQHLSYYHMAKILQYVIIIECINPWSEFGGISCEAVIRAGHAWDQEVTSALSVIAVVWSRTRQTPWPDKINWGSGGGGGMDGFLPVLCGRLAGRTVRLWPPIASSPTWVSPGTEGGGEESSWFTTSRLTEIIYEQFMKLINNLCNLQRRHLICLITLGLWTVTLAKTIYLKPAWVLRNCEGHFWLFVGIL